MSAPCLACLWAKYTATAPRNTTRERCRPGRRGQASIAAVPPHSDGFVVAWAGVGTSLLRGFAGFRARVTLVVPPTPTARTQDGALTACRFEVAGTGKVRAITDGRSFILEDGREIRLSAIEVPLAPAAAESGPRAEAGLAARAALESMLASQSVELRQNAAGADRYGRTLAMVYVMRDGAQQSAAHEMLARGFARVAAHVGDRPCAEELLAQERGARRAKLGLWGEPYYVIAAAENGAQLAAERGRFTVAEGKVVSVRESGRHDLRQFRTAMVGGLTVTISKRNERVFAAAGVEPKKLANLRVRVRGWIEERNGPRIEATRPEQIEIAERDVTDCEATPESWRGSETCGASARRHRAAPPAARSLPRSRSLLGGLQLVAAHGGRTARGAPAIAKTGRARDGAHRTLAARARAHSRRL